jgi:hypothetical protein
MSKFYAGIGSRLTPQNILEDMTRLAGRFCNLNYILRSGGAVGADQAFAAKLPDEAKVILKAKDATPAAIELAGTIHPAWNLCDDYARKLHGRNCMIILGPNLDEPVEFVVCWQDPYMDRGGTRLGMRLAESRGISVYNLAVPGHYKLLLDERNIHAG